jgi:hypothetical protein
MPRASHFVTVIITTCIASASSRRVRPGAATFDRRRAFARLAGFVFFDRALAISP